MILASFLHADFQNYLNVLFSFVTNTPAVNSNLECMVCHWAEIHVKEETVLVSERVLPHKLPTRHWFFTVQAFASSSLDLCH